MVTHAGVALACCFAVSLAATPENLATKGYTLAELATYDGTNTAKPLLISFKGVIFDVTSGGDFYGPGATYHIMAGHEIARSVAEYKLEPELFHADLSGLSEEKLKAMEEIYQETYITKYPIVGHISSSGEASSSPDAMENEEL
jgi:membrane-associated progesterone receptor component